MSRFLNGPYQTLEAYVPGEQPRDMRCIKLNTNESPYPPAPSVVAAITPEEIRNLRLYGDPTARVLKGKLAQLYGVKEENVFLGNGSDEILSFAFMAFGEKGVLFPDISYGFYEVYARLYGLNAEKIPLKEDFSLDCQDYCGRDKMVVIANPNAPTGLAVPASEVEKILSSNPDALVLIDEAYVDFGGETCLPLIRNYDNLLVTRTFSKSRCLAGGRLGYAFGRAAVIADLEKIKFSTNPYNVDRLTMALGEATVDAEAYYQSRCREIMATRDWTAEQLRAMGFTVLPSRTNFIFAKTYKMEGIMLYRKLKEQGILVRHFDSPRIESFNRITIGTRQQMEIFLETVRGILGGNV